MTAVGIFDFNDYRVERSIAGNLFKITNMEGELVDLTEEERDGFLVSALYDFRAYMLQ